MTSTTETKPTITWTNFKGEWMLKSNQRLEECSWVEVTKKDGSTSRAKVGEYEKCFKNEDGTESHIFSICRFTP